MKLKICKKCGALVEILEDCICEHCGIMCCGEKMENIIANSSVASEEKHIPMYEKVEDELFVRVVHPMEKDHFIEWLMLETDNKIYKIKLYPEQNAEARFPYIKNSTIYSYCNKHGLWSKRVL